jgi:hypothetical protein
VILGIGCSSISIQVVQSALRLMRCCTRNSVPISIFFTFLP